MKSFSFVFCIAQIALSTAVTAEEQFLFEARTEVVPVGKWFLGSMEGESRFAVLFGEMSVSFMGQSAVAVPEVSSLQLTCRDGKLELVGTLQNVWREQALDSLEVSIQLIFDEIISFGGVKLTFDFNDLQEKNLYVPLWRGSQSDEIFSNLIEAEEIQFSISNFSDGIESYSVFEVSDQRDIIDLLHNSCEWAVSALER